MERLPGGGGSVGDEPRFEPLDQPPTGQGAGGRHVTPQGGPTILSAGDALKNNSLTKKEPITAKHIFTKLASVTGFTKLASVGAAIKQVFARAVAALKRETPTKTEEVREKIELESETPTVSESITNAMEKLQHVVEADDIAEDMMKVYEEFKSEFKNLSPEDKIKCLNFLKVAIANSTNMTPEMENTETRESGQVQPKSSHPNAHLVLLEAIVGHAVSTKIVNDVLELPNRLAGIRDATVDLDEATNKLMEVVGRLMTNSDAKTSVHKQIGEAIRTLAKQDPARAADFVEKLQAHDLDLVISSLRTISGTEISSEFARALVLKPEEGGLRNNAKALLGGLINAHMDHDVTTGTKPLRGNDMTSKVITQALISAGRDFTEQAFFSDAGKDLIREMLVEKKKASEDGLKLSLQNPFELGNNKYKEEDKIHQPYVQQLGQLAQMAQSTLGSMKAEDFNEDLKTILSVIASCTEEHNDRLEEWGLSGMGGAGFAVQTYLLREGLPSPSNIVGEMLGITDAKDRDLAQQILKDCTSIILKTANGVDWEKDRQRYKAAESERKNLVSGYEQLRTAWSEVINPPIA